MSSSNSFEVIQIPDSRAFKDGDDLFIEVPVSGVVEDRQGDIVSKDCGDDMIQQYKSGIIPLYGDHGVDENGNKSYSWKNILGKWVDAKWAANGIDILAVAKLNKANDESVKLYSYVDQKMPVGFSIGGDIVEEGEY